MAGETAGSTITAVTEEAAVRRLPAVLSQSVAYDDAQNAQADVVQVRNVSHTEEKGKEANLRIPLTMRS